MFVSSPTEVQFSWSKTWNEKEKEKEKEQLEKELIAVSKEKEVDIEFTIIVNWLEATDA